MFVNNLKPELFAYLCDCIWYSFFCAFWQKSCTGSASMQARERAAPAGPAELLNSFDAVK